MNIFWVVTTGAATGVGFDLETTAGTVAPVAGEVEGVGVMATGPTVVSTGAAIVGFTGSFILL